jgi:hypothetical protein
LSSMNFVRFGCVDRIVAMLVFPIPAFQRFLLRSYSSDYNRNFGLKYNICGRPLPDASNLQIHMKFSSWLATSSYLLPVLYSCVLTTWYGTCTVVAIIDQSEFFTDLCGK